MENDARLATDDITDSYSKMHDRFEMYLDAITCFEFENGFYYALELVKCGEIRGLKYTDIDKKVKIMHVQRTLKYIERVGYIEDTPKQEHH